MVPPSKTADRPHRWTIFLSLLAIAVSLASFCQSREALRINREVSRAVVQVSSVRLTDIPDHLSFLTIDLTLTNYGQVTARNIVTTLEWEVSNQDLPLSDATYEQPVLGDLAPKSSETMRLQANRLFSGESERSGNFDPIRPPRMLLVYGVAHYTDDASGLPGSNPWCYVFDPKEHLQKESLDLRPCEYRPRDPGMKK